MAKDFHFLFGYNNIYIQNLNSSDYQYTIYVCIIVLNKFYKLFDFQNKVFVYRGLEYERMEAFVQRLQTEFPTAELLTKNTPPSQTILQSDAQCWYHLFVCNKFNLF